MKTRFKTLIVLVAIFLCSLTAGIVAGCSIGEPPVSASGLDCCVTYYINGGSFNSSTTMSYTTLYFKSGAPILNVGVDKVNNITYSVSRTNYYFNGWKYAALDENGQPILRDSEGTQLTVKPSGSPEMLDDGGRELSEQSKVFTAEIDETRGHVFGNGHPTINKDEHLYLVADWTGAARLDYVLVADEAVTFTDGNEDNPVLTTVEPGEVVYGRDFGSFSVINLDPENDLKNFVSTTHSYIHLYWDEECRNPVVATEAREIPKPEPDENGEVVNPVIYAKYVSGNWTPVRDSDGVANMFKSSGLNSLAMRQNFYLVGNITYSGNAIARDNTFNTNCTINGNGFTISNLVFASQRALVGGAKVSVFGTLTDNANIYDLTLKDVTLNVTFNKAMSGTAAYLLFTDMNDGATLNNFLMDGATLNATLNGAIVTNLQTDDHFIYGTGNTDAEFAEAHGELVLGAVLNRINPEE